LQTLSRFCPEVATAVYYPPADQEFMYWLQKLHFKNIFVRTKPIPGAYGWNNKPHALLELLNEGYDEAIWIDTDILLTGSVMPVFANLTPTTLAITEEALLAPKDDDARRRVEHHSAR
jgi:hypothetical protein